MAQLQEKLLVCHFSPLGQEILTDLFLFEKGPEQVLKQPVLRKG